MQGTQARGGFTLIEILVAVSILTMAIAGAAFLMTSAYGTYRHQDRTLVMDQLVHDGLEKLTAAPYDQLRTDIRQARAPQNPPHDGTPPDQDFESVTGGQAVANYELDPPTQAGDDWTPRLKPSSDVITIVHDQQADNALHAAVELEFWDPSFDAPTLTDHGLIRAVYTLRGAGMPVDRGVKYLAR